MSGLSVCQIRRQIEGMRATAARHEAAGKTRLAGLVRDRIAEYERELAAKEKQDG